MADVSILPTSGVGAHPEDYDLGYLWRMARVHRPALIRAHLVALLAVLASVPIPLLFPLLVDEVLLGQPGPLLPLLQPWFPAHWHGPVLWITLILAVSLLLRLLFLVFGVWQLAQFTAIAKDLTYRLRHHLLLHLQRVSMTEYETLGSGTVASHLVTDINAVDNFIGASISKTLIAVLTLAGTTVVLLWMHWQLALFILLLNPLVIYCTVLLGKKVKLLKKRENTAFEIFQQALSETLDAIQEIRAGNREGHYIADVVGKARGIKAHSAAFSWRSDAANRLSFAVFLFGFDVFRALSMVMVVFSDLTIGEMMAVFGYLWFMMAPVQELLNVQFAFFGAKAALGRLNRLLGLQQEPQYPHLANPFAGKTTVGLRIDDVCFSYATGGDSVQVLDHVNLDIRPGEKVALVGASGGGKSTLIQVILGLYAPQSGTLSFDGVPVQEIGLDVVRQHVATVLQQPALFNDTVRMNLTMGQEMADEKLWQALEIAQLKSLVQQMPDGLDSVIGRQGVRLSGGQRQRLAIARMVLSNPQVVILDEATSALDTETEAELHRALSNFLRDRTTLIIAHRLSAVRQADRVYVFDGGRVVEEGRHHELVHGGGLYQRLYGAAQQ